MWMYNLESIGRVYVAVADWRKQEMKGTFDTTRSCFEAKTSRYDILKVK